MLQDFYPPRERNMKNLLMATTAISMMAGAAFADGHAEDVKIGVILGFTGPLESHHTSHGRRR